MDRRWEPEQGQRQGPVRRDPRGSDAQLASVLKEALSEASNQAEETEATFRCHRGKRFSGTTDISWNFLKAAAEIFQYKII